MFPEISNIYSKIPTALPSELFQTITEQNNIRIERIVSDGQTTPAGMWYDQSWDEWVILLSGSAGLCFEGEIEERQLLPGDYLLIPRGCRHRVQWTDQEQKTVWLAVHIMNSVEKENSSE